MSDNPYSVQDDPNPPGGLKEGDLGGPDDPTRDKTTGANGVMTGGKTGSDDLRHSDPPSPTPRPEGKDEGPENQKDIMGKSPV